MIQTRQAEAAGWWVFNPLLPVARIGVFRYAQVAHRAWRRCVPARCAHTGPPVREGCPRLRGAVRLASLEAQSEACEPPSGGEVRKQNIRLSLHAGGSPSVRGLCVRPAPPVAPRRGAQPPRRGPEADESLGHDAGRAHGQGGRGGDGRLSKRAAASLSQGFSRPPFHPGRGSGTRIG